MVKYDASDCLFSLAKFPACSVCNACIVRSYWRNCFKSATKRVTRSSDYACIKPAVIG